MRYRARRVSKEETETSSMPGVEDLTEAIGLDLMKRNGGEVNTPCEKGDVGKEVVHVRSCEAQIRENMVENLVFPAGKLDPVSIVRVLDSRNVDWEGRLR